MPPRVKTTKEMIINAAFEITRSHGIEAINAKSVANYLNCSTQPVMYNFATIEELKLTVFDKAFDYMKEQVVFPKGKKSEYPMREVGLDYISFARKEPNLFKLLFESSYSERCPVDDLGVDLDLQPVIELTRRSGRTAIMYFFFIGHLHLGICIILTLNKRKRAYM